MIKRNIKLMTTLVLTLSLAIGVVTANAAPLNTSNSTEKVECRGGKHNVHAGSINLVLKNNLGFTDAQIQDARSSGKTAFDLGKEKSKTPDQLKAMIIAAKSKEMDERVVSGKITKEKADIVKANFNAKMQNWDGSLKHKKHGKKAK